MHTGSPVLAHVMGVGKQPTTEAAALGRAHVLGMSAGAGSSTEAGASAMSEWGTPPLKGPRHPLLVTRPRWPPDLTSHLKAHPLCLAPFLDSAYPILGEHGGGGGGRGGSIR